MKERHWIRSPGEVRGVAVVVHGLNIDPDAMRAWATVLNQEGLDVLLVGLSGHRTSPYGASLSTWHSEYGAALAEAQAEAGELPVFSLGYSLGAALSVSYLEANTDSTVDGLVLIAPAIQLRPYTQITRAILALRHLRVRVFSAVPRRFRAHRLTALASYHALFQTVESVSALRDSTRFQRIPTLALFSPRDPLVSLSRFSDWTRIHKLDQWEIEPIPVRNLRKAHLILDEEAVGEAAWRVATASVRDFIREQVRFEEGISL